DIGLHFPPSDPRWRGAASDRFLRHAADLVRARGGVVAAVDVTIICERPKIGPHRAAMVERVAQILGIAVSRVSIKATTTDKLGFTGRGDGRQGEHCRGPRRDRDRRGRGAMACAGGGTPCPPPLRPCLSAVPDLRHLEAVAGAMGRLPCRGWSRHHARRSLCRGLRYPL